MIIKVTSDHIKRGDRRSPGCCPIALAVKEACRLPFVSVGINSVSWSYNEGVDVIHECIFEPDSSLVEFITRFDLGSPVQPFEFDLPLP
jgi:hypothetical protein